MNHYLTTPIYYASGAPHLGHAYTTLLAESYKRFYALQGHAVLLASGTDEHGQKIERTALAAGEAPQEFVDLRSAEFERLWETLAIPVDVFERTTRENHKAFAQAFWQRLVANDDIYFANYEGLYCVECEQYFTEGDTCPVHRRPLELFAEPSWFFRLGCYRQALIAHIESHPAFIRPEARKNEVLAFLRSNELRDLSISRGATRWGVPVPGDATHVQYVWIDALVTYLSALSPDKLCAFDDPVIARWWQHTTHFIGKDILVFHAVYWPALLLSAGLPLPESLIVNGWLTVEGRKIAKSDPATIVDPVALTATVGSDAIKLYFLKAVTLGQDLDFSRAQLVQSTNADLANNIGNLFSRFVAISGKQLDGHWCKGSALDVADEALLDQVVQTATGVAQGFDSANPGLGARGCIALAASINAYLQQQAPWKIEDRARLATVLWTVHHALADFTILASPFIPEISKRARAALGLSDPARWQALGVRREWVSTTGIGPLYLRVEEPAG